MTIVSRDYIKEKNTIFYMRLFAPDNFSGDFSVWLPQIFPSLYLASISSPSPLFNFHIF